MTPKPPTKARPTRANARATTTRRQKQTAIPDMSPAEIERMRRIVAHYDDPTYDPDLDADVDADASDVILHGDDGEDPSASLDHDATPDDSEDDEDDDDNAFYDVDQMDAADEDDEDDTESFDVMADAPPAPSYASASTSLQMDETLPEGSAFPTRAEATFIQSLYRDAPPMPRPKPPKVSGWIDLGDSRDPKTGRPLFPQYRGWAIRVRKELPLDWMEAAQTMQQQIQRARAQRLQGTRGAQIPVGAIRTLIARAVVAWNFPDEFGVPLPRPPQGVGLLTDALLGPTFNAMMRALRVPKGSSRR